MGYCNINSCCFNLEQTISFIADTASSRDNWKSKKKELVSHIKIPADGATSLPTL